MKQLEDIPKEHIRRIRHIVEHLLKKRYCDRSHNPLVGQDYLLDGMVSSFYTFEDEPLPWIQIIKILHLKYEP